MTIELFFKALLITSVLVGLFTQAIKKQLDELKVKYFSNLLAGIVAIATSVAVSLAYTLINGIIVNLTILIYIIILALMSWLCSMVGYDKVIQSIQQVITKVSTKDGE